MDVTRESRPVVVDLRNVGSPDGCELNCPSCGGSRFEVVTEGDDVDFLCVSCTSCWHVELGYISRVDRAVAGASASEG